MPAEQPFGGGIFIADTSAWSRAHNEAVAAEWFAALTGGQIATSPIVAFELLYTARDAEAFDRLAADLAQLRDIPITRSVTNAASRALRDLAHRRPPGHRAVRTADLLIGAAAQDAALGVLHYDRRFDLLATVLDFESRWIAPPGSLP